MDRGGGEGIKVEVTNINVRRGGLVQNEREKKKQIAVRLLSREAPLA